MVESAPYSIVVQFAVPVIPVAKQRARVVTGGAYTPRKTRDYETMVGYRARSAMGGKPPTEAAVVLLVEFGVPIPSSWTGKRRSDAEAGLVVPASKPDLTNYVKAIEDAMNGIVYRDDSQIVSILASKSYSKTPMLNVSVITASY